MFLFAATIPFGTAVAERESSGHVPMEQPIRAHLNHMCWWCVRVCDVRADLFVGVRRVRFCRFLLGGGVRGGTVNNRLVKARADI
jgi:hypothetical protein